MMAASWSEANFSPYVTPYHRSMPDILTTWGSSVLQQISHKP